MSINTANVIDTLNARKVNDSQLHGALVAMLRQCENVSKKDLLSAPELRAVFSHEVMARHSMRQVVTWVHSYTPIRVKFKGNGQFEKLRFARKPVWDLDTAEIDPFYNHEATSTKKAASGSLERGMSALAREVARKAYEGNTPASTIEEAREKVARELFAAVLEEMESERFEAWAAKFDEQREAKAREDGAKDAARKAEVVDLINRINRARAA